MLKFLTRPSLLITDRTGNTSQVLSTDQSVCTIREQMSRSRRVRIGGLASAGILEKNKKDKRTVQIRKERKRT